MSTHVVLPPAAQVTDGEYLLKPPAAPIVRGVVSHYVI